MGGDALGEDPYRHAAIELSVTSVLGQRPRRHRRDNGSPASQVAPFGLPHGSSVDAG